MNFVSLQKALAQNKVYDAWQYVQSLAETLGYAPCLALCASYSAVKGGERNHHGTHRT